MQIALQSVDTVLSRLVEAAENGEDVTFTREGRPIVRLVLVPTLKRGKRTLGRGEGLVTLPTDEEWRAMDKEIEELMCDAPLTSDGTI